MRIAVTGSIATDHLMVFPGRIADQLIPGQLDRLSLSFLADTLDVRRGGVAANIAVGLARLGLRPVLVGAAGKDFAEYDAWLRNTGVDTGSVRVSETLHTARFLCTTDADQNQIATFYAGAMAEAREIPLASVRERAGTLGLVVIAPDDPEAMLRHTRECRELGLPFVADPSQQLARLGREETRDLVTGAAFLFTNAYEAALLQERTGWTEAEVLGRAGTWVTTLGADGAVVAQEGGTPQRVTAVPATEAVDPTGVGDAFRAGFLAAVAWRLPLERAAQLGCALATSVLESVGTQEYKIVPADLLRRIDDAYQPSRAAADLEPFLAGLS
ncbi:carbohydrate kinase family protein [Streptomyces noursei]|uniref:carbohydrate kinase family protein n=1 Tax=Streptomyces noursei TaxID=1971 RepID=UPI00167AE715|nr:carbohydrate kinase family protein [Streptomyces noursei]MCZ1018734.1 carbohydrate kinase family protein [Streptomyces noursei]GGX26880.1 kinase [Streptomyces noursei]